MKCSKCGFIVCAASLQWLRLNTVVGGVAEDLATGLLGTLGEVLSHAFVRPWKNRVYAVCGRCAALRKADEEEVLLAGALSADAARELKRRVDRQLQGR